MNDKKIDKIIKYINKTGLTAKEFMILIISLKEYYDEELNRFIKENKKWLKDS